MGITAGIAPAALGGLLFGSASRRKCGLTSRSRISGVRLKHTVSMASLRRRSRPDGNKMLLCKVRCRRISSATLYTLSSRPSKVRMLRLTRMSLSSGRLPMTKARRREKVIAFPSVAASATWRSRSRVRKFEENLDSAPKNTPKRGAWGGGGHLAHAELPLPARGGARMRAALA